MSRRLPSRRRSPPKPVLALVPGATATGVIDRLAEFAAIARENSYWSHVDPAYRGTLAFSENHRGKLKGFELDDSVSFDPHK